MTTNDRAILTQGEVKQHVAWTLLALRQDVNREMEAAGEPLESTSDFYAVLYELGERFGLELDQQLLVCGLQVCRLYAPSPVVAAADAVDVAVAVA